MGLMPTQIYISVTALLSHILRHSVTTTQQGQLGNSYKPHNIGAATALAPFSVHVQKPTFLMSEHLQPPTPHKHPQW